MRISTAYQYDTYRRDVSSAQSRMFDAQQRVNTGKRINQISDDPYGTSTLISMRSVQSGLTQYGKNLNTAKGTLGTTEQALGDMADVMSSAYTLALSGANATADQASRMGMASQVEALQKRLVALGNTQGPSGTYLFAGQKTDAPPFAASGGTLNYSGDTNPVLVETSANSTMDVNSPGSTLMGDAYARLESLRQNLISGSVSNLSDVDVAALQSSQDAITLERGNVGAKLQLVTDMTNQHSRRVDDLTANISDVEEIDYAQAITEYQSADAAYQAALTVVSQGSRLSLMDYIQS